MSLWSDGPQGSDNPGDSGVNDTAHGDGSGTTGNESGNEAVTFNQENWRDALIPEELQSEPSLADFKDPGDIIKSYVHAQRMIGADKIAVPGPDATEDEWRAVFDKLGRPSSPDGYDVQVPETIPEGMEWRTDKLDAFKGLAHEIGLNNQQVNKLVDWYDTGQMATHDELVAATREDVKKNASVLYDEWGNAYEQNLKTTENAAFQIGGERFVNFLNDTGLANQAEMQLFLLELSRAVSEDKITGDGDSGLFGVLTPGDAKARIGKVMGDSNHPYHNADHAHHKDAVEEMAGLYGMAYPGEA